MQNQSQDNEFHFPINDYIPQEIQNQINLNQNQSVHFPNQPEQYIHFPNQNSQSIHFPNQPTESIHFPNQPTQSMHFPNQPTQSMHFPNQPTQSIHFPNQQQFNQNQQQFNQNQQQFNQNQYGFHQNQNNMSAFNMNQNMFNPQISQEKRRQFQQQTEQEQKEKEEMKKQQYIQLGEIINKQGEMMKQIDTIKKIREEERKNCEMDIWFKYNNDIDIIRITANKPLYELLHEYINIKGNKNVKFYFHGEELVYNTNSPIVLHEIKGLRNGEVIIVKSV